MITFYFRGMPTLQTGYEFSFDVLSSWNGSVEDVKREFGQCGRNESICIVAEFDDEQTPWRLVSDIPYHASTRKLCVRDYRKMRADWPKFFIGRDDNIWDSDTIGPRGTEVMPVMFGPGGELTRGNQ